MQYLAFFATHLAQNQLAIFNLDRFLALARYQWYTEKLMYNKSYCSILFVINIALSALVNIPFPFLFSVDPNSDKCLVQSPEETLLLNVIMLGFWSIFYVAVPVFIIVPTNLYIYFKLR